MPSHYKTGRGFKWKSSGSKEEVGTELCFKISEVFENKEAH